MTRHRTADDVNDLHGQDDAGLPMSHVSEEPKRIPKSEAERALLRELVVMFTVYDFTRPDRVSLSRSIIAALEAAENL
jgi:tRNA(Leu) C34 or U34 (ribose-2'-O)-methylase TrmL